MSLVLDYVSYSTIELCFSMLDVKASNIYGWPWDMKPCLEDDGHNYRFLDYKIEEWPVAFIDDHSRCQGYKP